MTGVFMNIVNMSITAGITALVVIVLRPLFRKAPKWVSVLLWGLVAIRLVCPVAIESKFSLIPKTDWFADESVIEENYKTDGVAHGISDIDFSVPSSDIAVNGYYAENTEIDTHRDINVPFIFACIWLTGIAVMLIYTVLSTLSLCRRVRGARKIRENVFESPVVETPFVLGLLRPRIYVPCGVAEDSLAYVIAHEEAHIRRFDHLLKPLGFLLLALHWFNPILWVSFIFFCRDIEMACDERVVREYDNIRRADYSKALLECSVKPRIICACPLSFGEVGVKARIKSVLSYKKPAFWIVIIAIAVTIGVSVCFLTNPTKESDITKIEQDESLSVSDGQTKKNLTLKDVIELSEKGNDLTFSDFEEFRYTETGSGLYIRVYEIDDTFRLMIGGTSPDGEPMYMYLTLTADPDVRVDIREGTYTVQDFIRLKSSLSFTAIITEWDEWNDDTVFLGQLTLNLVEYIQDTDTARIEELGLTFQDMPNGYYIYDEKESTTVLKVPEGTEFIFFDWTDLFCDPQDSRYKRIEENSRWVSTQDIGIFAEYLETYKDNIPPFVFHVEDEKMTVREIMIM